MERGHDRLGASVRIPDVPVRGAELRSFRGISSVD